MIKIVKVFYSTQYLRKERSRTVFFTSTEKQVAKFDH